MLTTRTRTRPAPGVPAPRRGVQTTGARDLAGPAREGATDRGRREVGVESFPTRRTPGPGAFAATFCTTRKG